MLKSILIGLDDSDPISPAVELGLEWAKRANALAVGIAVVDEPGILTAERVLFAKSHQWHTTDPAPALLTQSCDRAADILRRFARRCEEAHVTCKTLEDVGTPFVEILAESQRYDLILLGRETHFNFGTGAEADETLTRVLQDSPRPVVTVPKSRTRGDSVVIAYDGSLQAARALYAFEASGLGEWQNVHVVTVSSNFKEAARHAGRAVEFLHLHGIKATSHPLETSVATSQVILRKVQHLNAGLLVMGAYGQPVLREFFLGSVTRELLKESPVPVFCYH